VLTIHNANISKHEAVVRIFGGSVLILTTMLNASVPPWLALIAVYPITTGIIQWEPITAALIMLNIKIQHYLCRKKLNHVQHKAYSA